MKVKLEKLTVKESAFIIVYAIFLLFSTLSQSFYYRYFISIYKEIIAVCAFFLILLEIDSVKSNKSQLRGLIICLILFALTYMGSRGAIQNTVPAIFLFVYGARKIRYEKIARFTLVMSAILLAFVILSAYGGLIENYVFTKRANGALRTRHYLGFRYALYAPTFYFNIACLLVFLRREKITIWECLIIGGIAYWLYRKTDARMTYYLVLLLLLSSLLIKVFPNVFVKRKKLIKGFICIYPVSFALSIGLTLKYSPSVPWMRNLNTFLGKRLSLGQMSIRTYGIPFLGRNIKWVGSGLDAYGVRSTETYTYVDSFYVQVLQHYGVLFIVLLLGIMVFVMLKIYNQNDLHLFVILSLIALHFIIDDLQLYLYYNTFWFAIANVLMGAAKSPQKVSNRKTVLFRTRINE